MCGYTITRHYLRPYSKPFISTWLLKLRLFADINLQDGKSRADMLLRVFIVDVAVT